MSTAATAAVSSRWPAPPGGPAAIDSKGVAVTPAGRAGQRFRVADLADEIEHRQARHHPVPAVERGGDGLGGVDRGGQPQAGRGRWQDALEERPAEPDALLLGQHEQHRQEPRAAAHDGRGEADDALPAGRVRHRPGRHDEAFRIGRPEVLVQDRDRGQVVRDRRLVEPPGVVVDRDPPDGPAGRQLVGPGRSQVRRLGPSPGRHAVTPSRGRAGHRPSSSSSGGGPPASGAPVARRSSSACMNVSRSPSRTAPVFDVSTPVRRSLTIW